MKVAIDVCAAPGSWSQLLLKKMHEGFAKSGSEEQVPEDCKLISVDLQPINQLKGAVTIQGDITKKETFDKIVSSLGGSRADLVVCDGAPDVTGFHDIDSFLQSQLLVAALNIALQTTKPDGHFVAKVFLSSDDFFLTSQFKLFYKQVTIFKPHSSRSSSAEHFIVCKFYDPPKHFALNFFSTFCGFQESFVKTEGLESEEKDKVVKTNEKIYEFVTNMDLSSFDVKLPN